MQNPISLKGTERKAFQSRFADGLWDVFLGCFALQFAIAPLLGESLGDFWGSMIFLPIWGVVYLGIWLLRKHVIAPRIGVVKFGQPRKAKLRKFTLVMLVFNLLAFFLGLLAMLNFLGDERWFFNISAGLFPGLLGLFILMAFSLAGALLDYPRLYVYGLLLSVAPLVGEWLYQNLGATHHGFPIVFGVAAAVMILTGLILFVRLLVKNPLVEMPEQGA